MRPVILQDVDCRSPHESGVPEPTPTRLFDARAVKDDGKEQLDSLHQLGRVFKEFGNDDFGLAVNLAFPWLAASPDRFVYDPEELTYGVLEIKCPYSLKDSQLEEAMSKKFCMIFEENYEAQLDREHEYYAQGLGQMVITGCLSADFVVCSENRIAIERICF
ncbi:hypothetical protein HPB52_013206 [Rhipicephalus sanguineus]|uniref:YqaJ viral recombinase domain-containing protein n=1 Tax=Rhipicephalus sanguineus TaxID=34632 RepID=A0A9D4Q6Q0_RHISA|nr:hypothetical protein HPB52_013206 [Rhipicephalus sanguineus]